MRGRQSFFKWRNRFGWLSVRGHAQCWKQPPLKKALLIFGFLSQATSSTGQPVFPTASAVGFFIRVIGAPRRR